MAINLVTGWNEVEARMYGGDILLHEDDRYVRAEEFLTILRGMWTETPFSFDGRFYKVKESQLLLKPATAPPPEIFTASRSERGLEMVAKYADWWFLDYDKDAADTAGVMDSLQAFDRRHERARREPRTQGALRLQSVRRLRRQRRGRASSAPSACLTPDEPDADVRKMMSRVGPAMKSGCIGRPEKVRDQLMRFHDMGIELFLLKFVPTVDEVQAIRANVIEPLRRKIPRPVRAMDAVA